MLVTCPQCGTKFNYESYNMVSSCPSCYYQMLNLNEENILKESIVDMNEEKTGQNKDFCEEQRIEVPQENLIEKQGQREQLVQQQIQPQTQQQARKKERRGLKFFFKIIGSLALILNFSAISGACGLIPIPFLGYIPLFASLCGLEFFLLLIFGKLKSKTNCKVGFIQKLYNRTAKKTLSRMFNGYSATLLAVNLPGNAIKAIPGVGTMIGMVISIICMACTTIVFGLLVFFPLVLSGPGKE